MSSTLRLLTGPVGATRAPARAAFARVLADRLEVLVEVRSTATYGDLLEHVLDSETELAWLPPAVLVRAMEESSTQLLASGVRHHRAHFQGALFCREDAPYENATDLAGARVAWVDRNSCAGFLFPRLALAQLELDADGLFAEQRFLADHVSVGRAVDAQDAEVGATFVQRASDAPDATIVGAGWELSGTRQRMRALLVSEPIPADAIVSTAACTDELRQRFVVALLNLHQSPDGAQVLRELFAVERFEPTTLERYEAVRAAMKVTA
ncbi:MAG: PhnD/SsuA/transferrin family substrate-binding protein [Sandaracinus sp.]|nr:PhnD/SsuA/transferrin family substrate-binding protein [Sandaracinus sp.]MCB9621362.1 PhnD/SsuA/transferrin family substrate-binding protein [Sandaracinus sp.]